MFINKFYPSGNKTSVPWILNPIFFICLYFVFQLYPFIRIPFVLSAVSILGFLTSALLQGNSIKPFHKTSTFWICIGYSLFCLYIFAFVGHGYQYSNTAFAYTLIRYIPEFLMALYLSNRKHGLFPVVVTIMVVCSFTGILSIIFNIDYYNKTGGSALRDRKEILMSTKGMGDVREMDAMGIIGVNAAASRAYLFAICLGYFLAVKRLLKPSVYAIFVALLTIMLLATILSGLTVPLILCAIAIIGFSVLLVRKLSSVIMLFVMATAFALGTFLSYQFNLTVFTKYFDKAWNLINRLTGTDGFIQEIDRYQLFMLSWETFLQNPIFGVGGRTGILGHGGVLIGGHSGFADTLGQFGLIGSLGFIVLFVYTIYTLYLLINLEKRNILGSFYFTFLVFFSIFFVHSFVNPTLGTFSITQVLIFVLGLMMGLRRSARPTSAILPPPTFSKSMYVYRR
jgi:hypothetical protein